MNLDEIIDGKIINFKLSIHWCLNVCELFRRFLLLQIFMQVPKLDK